jgi:capsular polysaccharide biosynthesis protein
MKVNQINTLAESSLISIKYPANFDVADESLFLPRKNYSTNNQEVLLVQDANVTDKGVVFSLLSKLDKAFVHSNLIKQFNKIYLLKVNLFYKKTSTDDDKIYVLAFDPWSARNYYHWVIDTLPRLFIIKDELNGVELLLPRNARRYMYESVEFFKPKGVLELKKHTYVRTKNLCLPKPVAESGRHDGSVLLGMKKFILSRLEKRDEVEITRERIYISRANQQVRKIHNEAEVRDMLAKYGFFTVYFENMSFTEQIAVMSKAKYVVSSHGANLTNILFMPEKAKVLEINKNLEPNLCYWSLASSVNLDYFYQFCPIAGDEPDIDNNADMLVDINKLRKNVELMLMN